jgi:tetratricopeptide (TPR) repeat protein
MTSNAQRHSSPFKPSIPLAADDHTHRVATALRDGIEQLERGHADDAVEHLTVVVEDPDFRDSSDMQDILARATSLLAQALKKQGDLSNARLRCSEAMELCQKLGDAAGIREVGELSSDIDDALRERDDAERRQRSLQQLGRTATAKLRTLYGKDPISLAEILLKKSSAELDAGRVEHAQELADEVLEQARTEGWRRQEVLARLTLARIRPDDAPTHLVRAWERAEQDNDHTLVSTVARVAELSGVTLSSLAGPEMPPKPADS